MNKVLIVIIENGENNFGVAPLEFDAPDKPFAIYETFHKKGKDEILFTTRIPLDPAYLEKLAVPRQGADYYYKVFVNAPKQESN